jgi:phage shock protein PspC (stress-responsive transcriptional regulator)
MNAVLPPPTMSIPDTPGVQPSPTPRAGLVRPRQGRRIGGVCAGIADRLAWSRTTVRLLSASTIPLPGPRVLVSLIAWIVIPSDDDLSTGSAVAA